VSTENADKIAELEAKLTEQADRIAELSKENTKWRRQAQGKDVAPEVQERIAGLEDEITRLKAEKVNADKAAKTATTDADKARKALEAAEGFTSKLLVDNGLTDALTKAGVTNPVHLKAAKALLAAQVQIVADGDSKVARVGDKPLADFATAWAKGDEGKHFVAAAQNGGGGSGGGGGAPTNTQPMTSTQKIAAGLAKL
jgi:hypothetical protein